MAETLQAIASLLWPIIVIILICVLIFMFKPAIAAIIESAKSRKFTIKVGNNELTMEEASKQQQSMITDVQKQLLELRNKLVHNGKSQTFSDVESNIENIKQNSTILWVDDNPKNNSYAVQQLNDMKINVDLALSTTDGLRRFRQNKYPLIISDLGRREENFMNYTAGFDFLKEIRSINPSIPFIIFTTSENVRIYMAQAKKLGVTLITSSWTEIVSFLFKEFS